MKIGVSKRGLWLLLVACLIFALAACSGQNEPSEAPDAARNPATDQAPSTSEESLSTEYPLTITDASGVELVFEQAPERIVSTSPAETEILFAIGMGDKIVAVSDFCNYPEETQSKMKVGGVTSPNIEAIIAAEPDLVVGGISLSMESAEAMRDHGLNLYVSRPKQIEEVLESIRILGLITDHQEQAEALIAKMQSDLEAVDIALSDLSESEKKRVYIEFAPGWTVGRGEFMHELIERAGGINIAADLEGWAQIDEEKVIIVNPEVIIYPEGVVLDDSGTTLADAIAHRPGWEAIDAVVQGNMHAVDADVLTRPGARVTEALLMLSRLIHPERLQ